MCEDLDEKISSLFPICPRERVDIAYHLHDEGDDLVFPYGLRLTHADGDIFLEERFSYNFERFILLYDHGDALSLHSGLDLCFYTLHDRSYLFEFCGIFCLRSHSSISSC